MTDKENKTDKADAADKVEKVNETDRANKTNKANKQTRSDQEGHDDYLGRQEDESTWVKQASLVEYWKSEGHVHMEMAYPVWHSEWTSA